jgi:hypothetical protein
MPFSFLNLQHSGWQPPERQVGAPLQPTLL